MMATEPTEDDRITDEDKNSTTDTASTGITSFEGVDPDIAEAYANDVEAAHRAMSFRNKFRDSMGDFADCGDLRNLQGWGSGEKRPAFYHEDAKAEEPEDVAQDVRINVDVTYFDAVDPDICEAYPNDVVTAKR